MRYAIATLLLTVILHGCAPRSEAGARAAADSAPSPTAAALQPTFRGEVGVFSITNDGGAPLTERVVTFGQVFRPGEIGRGSPLAVTLNGAQAASQMDAKAFYPDGSVRHAVISVRAPALRPGATLKGVISAEGPALQRPAPAVMAPPPPLTLQLTFAGSPPLEVDLASIERSTAPRPAPWLGGPLVREQRYWSHVGALDVAFDVLTPLVGPARIDVIFHNDAAQNDRIATETYGARLMLGPRLVYEAAAVTQHPYQTWRCVVYSDGAAPPRVTPDPQLLIAVGAAPHYGRFQPDPQAVADLNKTATASRPPLGSVGNVTPYMPTTGGRPDIGPLPGWAAFYLLDPSRQNQETLFANADVSGAIPWHVRDVTTDGPIRLDQHPGVWLDYRGRAVPGVLNRKYEPTDGIWSIDDAHQPSLTYLPYLLTGSQYYRDELTMQAGFVLLAVSPEYRGGADGMVIPSQLRAIAWDLRTLANAAYILPADDPFQAYFETKLHANLQELSRRFVKGPELAGAGELTGYVPGAYDEDHTAPWQDDYLVMVLGWIHAMGYSEARPILGWMTNFVAGRFTNGARGYDPNYGTPYILYVADPKSKVRLNTWAAAFKASFDPVKAPQRQIDNPDWAGGYAALARASLATLLYAAPSAQAAAAYAFVKEQTPRMEASYRKEPAFAIVPPQEPVR